MFIVENYSLAVVLCLITMLCWGSWGNTQKLAAKTWRYELFYWDYVIGILLFSLLIGFTLGSFGENGRSFTNDLAQADSGNIMSAILGGIIFNASNILLSSSISLAGMAVAFPLGVGIALVLGVFVNYFSDPKGDSFLLFIGVALVIAAIIFNGLAAGKIKKEGDAKKLNKKGIWLAVLAGILMAFFYRFVAASMDLNDFKTPAKGMLTPYSAFFIFSIGVFISNFIFNSFIMKRPIEGKAVTYGDYFKGNFKTHCVGILGGVIWGIGTSLSYIAAGKAGTAVSYALGQGAPMIAAIWGVFIWKEFKGAKKTVNILIALVFVLFISGLSLIVVAGNKESDNQTKDPINVIFETDMGNDVDDAMALDMLYKAIDDKKVNLLAVMSNNESPYSVGYIDILNNWYGYPTIPIGWIKGKNDSVSNMVNYAEKVCEIKNEKGLPYFTRSWSDPQSVTEASKLYRQILAKQPDQSVTIISVGFSTNIASLLVTQPDEISPLSGRDLVARKVKLLSVMACSFGEHPIAEFNVRTDVRAAKTVFSSWPTKIVVAPFEAGNSVEYPATSIENDFKWSAGKHPLIEAYRVYLPMPYNRPTWDLIPVLYVLDPLSLYFSCSKQGIISIDDKGYSSFIASEKGNHCYLSLTSDQADSTREYFIRTISRKPINKRVIN